MFSRLPRRAPFATVIVDTRRHEALLEVLRNVAYFLPHWAMYIFHAAGNEQFIIQELGPESRVNLRPTLPAEFTHRDYNRLLASSSFWEAIDAEKVLIFQPDAFLRRCGIAEFVEYDYIGAPWAKALRGSNGASLRVGNGGLSLRNRAQSLAITMNHEWMGQHEDIYFAEHFQSAPGAHLPDPATAARFAVETIDHPDPMGVHDARRYLGAEREDELRVVNTTSRPYELAIVDAFYDSGVSRVDVREKVQALVQEDRLFIPRAVNLQKVFSSAPFASRAALDISWKKTWPGGRADLGKSVAEVLDHHLAHGDIDV